MWKKLGVFTQADMQLIVLNIHDKTRNKYENFLRLQIFSFYIILFSLNLKHFIYVYITERFSIMK